MKNYILSTAMDSTSLPTIMLHMAVYIATVSRSVFISSCAPHSQCEQRAKYLEI